MTWLTRDWELKLLALLVACTLWLFVVSGDRSEVALAAPVEFVNVPPGLVRTGATPERVTVRVDGLRSTLARLSDGGLRAEVDLSGLGPGEASVRLGPDDVRVPGDVNVVGVSPARLAVVLEPLATVTRPVAPSLIGAPAPGYRVTEVRVEPPTVEVDGPESLLSGLAEVASAPLDVSGAREPVSRTVELAPVPGVRMRSTRTVHVTARVEADR